MVGTDPQLGPSANSTKFKVAIVASPNAYPNGGGSQYQLTPIFQDLFWPPVSTVAGRLDSSPPINLNRFAGPDGATKLLLIRPAMYINTKVEKVATGQLTASRAGANVSSQRRIIDLSSQFEKSPRSHHSENKMTTLSKWTTKGFDEFRRGSFGNAGQNIYVS